MRNTLVLGMASVFFCGCAVVRGVDHALPGMRLDKPYNRALPDAADDQVAVALAAWQAASPEEREAYPTAYHRYVQTPAPGYFEGEHVVGLAFSGGGMRGMLFQAACVKELKALGDIIVTRPADERRIDVLAEADYVSGVSTGSVMATLFTLNRGGQGPEQFREANWPSCFNLNPKGPALKQFAMAPHRILTDFGVEMNTRPLGCAYYASVYFGGDAARPQSGLTFGDLPATPVLLLGSLIINDPASMLVQTRLPYRYTLDEAPTPAWRVGDQSFESFHTDPMCFPLGEACYNSLSFPGTLRSGLIAVRKDVPWVLEGVVETDADRMRRAREQVGFDGVYYLKDGGMVDNRGLYMLSRIAGKIKQEQPATRMPLLIGFDADKFEVRPPGQGGGWPRQGWMKEWAESSRALFQTEQQAYMRLVEQDAAERGYAVITFDYAAWTHNMPGEGAATPATQQLQAFCAEEPLIGTAEELLAVTRGIGTTFMQLDDAEVAAIRVAARFAIWEKQGALLEWGASMHDGEARFEGISE